MIPPVAIWRRENPDTDWPGSRDQRHFERQPCIVCGDWNGHAHHADYDKPLDVIFLCRRHHTVLHHRILKRVGPTQGYTKQLHDEILQEIQKEFGPLVVPPKPIPILRGPMGFGKSSHLHTAKILRLSLDLPMVILLVHSEIFTGSRNLAVGQLLRFIEWQGCDLFQAPFKPNQANEAPCGVFEKVKPSPGSSHWRSNESCAS
jgi:uncharacterized protein DUF190